MTQSEVITILNNFQLKFDVNNIKYNNKAVWPIIRYYMAYTLLKPKSNNIEDDKTSSNLVKNKMGFFISRIFLKLYKLIALFEWPILYIKLQKQKSVFNKSIKKCLFVSPFNELYPDVIDGKKYSRYLDPYYELFQKKEPIAKFQLLENKQVIKNNYIPIVSLNQDVFLKKNKIKKYFNKKNKFQDRIFEQHLMELNAFAKLNQIDYFFNNWLINHLDEVNDYECFFTHFLFKSNVKCVFIECYYSPCLFGLIAACKKLSIKTIDIQHGVVDVNYLGWKNINKEMELYLPQYYWAWSVSDFNTVKKENDVKINVLTPIIGGNMWMAKFINTKQINSIQNHKNHKKNILVTLQFGAGFMDYMSDLIVELITLSKQDYYWMFRFHPINSEEEKIKFKKRLDNFANTDFEEINKMQLYEAFKVVQSHIVISSAVALEVIQFNLQTIIVHDLGADLFKDLIFDNTMCFSKNPKEIINQIENFFPKQMKNDFKIQTSEEAALKQFELLIA